METSHRKRGPRIKPNQTIALTSYRIGIVIQSKKYGTKVAIVDASDYLGISGYNWSVRAWKRKLQDTPAFYVRTTIHIPGGKTTSLFLHRAIMHPAPEQEVDHKNSDGLDNSRENLRVCTQTENTRNTRPQIGCSSRFKGVYFSGTAGKWHAIIRVARKTHSLGFYCSEIEAAQAYDGAARHFFKDFAWLNSMGKPLVRPVRREQV